MITRRRISIHDRAGSTTFSTWTSRTVSSGACPQAGWQQAAQITPAAPRLRGEQNSQQLGQIVTGVPSYLVKLNPGNTSLYSVPVSRKIEIAIASPSLIPSTPSDR